MLVATCGASTVGRGVSEYVVLEGGCCKDVDDVVWVVLAEVGIVLVLDAAARTDANLILSFSARSLSTSFL